MELHYNFDGDEFNYDVADERIISKVIKPYLVQEAGLTDEKTTALCADAKLSSLLNSEYIDNYDLLCEMICEYFEDEAMWEYEDYEEAKRKEDLQEIRERNNDYWNEVL